MEAEDNEDKVVFPHHEQQSLCTTRLPYRQGRKLTAIKVYTVNNESNHLLIFGVPSLKLRQEIKSLFAKFGKLLQFAATTKYPSESFTETYHAVFERITSARIAKKMLDTKNFYGGSLHICYAPELEEISETRRKILQRQKDVLNRLRNLHTEKSTKEDESKPTTIIEDVLLKEHKKLNMGEINTIGIGKQIRDVVLNKKKRKNPQQQNAVIEKQFKPCFTGEEVKPTASTLQDSDNSCVNNIETTKAFDNSKKDEIEIIDFTSVETETITNINANLNYNKFGNEVIKKVPEKPINKIKFNIANKR
ncbi:hypothetical protein NE865_11355 [Phthorimaea operculella]|nr:hypothetical protein NE865_11355 [Phthorimaea operculella]